MITLKIKKASTAKFVAFSNNTKKLGELDKKALLDLAIIARSSGDKTLLNHFEQVPSLKELQLEKLKQK